MYKLKKQAKPGATGTSIRASAPAPVSNGRAAGPGPGSEALAKSIGYSLRRAQLSTYDEFSRAMQPFDVRPSQFSVLVLIRANPGLTQSAVCSALGIQKTNFVALLDKLESRGLTERRKVGGDRRASALHLTADGQSLVGRIEAAHHAMEGRLAQRLGPKQTRELLALLHQFTAKASPMQEP